MIPQQLVDALEAAISARNDVDIAEAVKAESDQRNALALAENTAAIADLANKTDILDVYRQQLEALEDEFLRPGGTLPESSLAAATTPMSSSTMKAADHGQVNKKA